MSVEVYKHRHSLFVLKPLAQSLIKFPMSIASHSSGPILATLIPNNGSLSLSPDPKAHTINQSAPSFSNSCTPTQSSLENLVPPEKRERKIFSKSRLLSQSLLQVDDVRSCTLIKPPLPAKLTGNHHLSCYYAAYAYVLCCVVARTCTYDPLDPG